MATTKQNKFFLLPMWKLVGANFSVVAPYSFCGRKATEKQNNYFRCLLCWLVAANLRWLMGTNLWRRQQLKQNKYFCCLLIWLVGTNLSDPNKTLKPYPNKHLTIAYRTPPYTQELATTKPWSLIPACQDGEMCTRVPVCQDAETYASPCTTTWSTL